MRVRAMCLLGVQVAVEGEGWMVLAKANYYYGIFCQRKGCVYSENSI